MTEPARKKRRTDTRGVDADADPTTIAITDAHENDLSYGDFSRRASKWNLEQAYEQRPRKQKGGKESNRLPIKTAEGRVEQVQRIEDEEDELRSSEDELPSDTPASSVSGDGRADEIKSQIPVQEQISQAKEELARIATLINEAPEEHVGSLKAIAEITTSSEVKTITKLGLATQLAVYKDIIPGYRIRPASEDELKGRISKDVKKLRNFEQSIVRGYQKYVQELARVASLRKADSCPEVVSLAAVAVSCACNLVTSVPHFNFRTDLLKILVHKLSGRSGSDEFNTCLKALQQLFAEDEEGHASLEAVGMLVKMIKARRFRIDGQVLNLFLQLRLLNEFAHKASTERVDKAENGAPDATKHKKAQREFRTKQTRKLLKERKAIEKEMKEADAVVSHEQRDQMQAETLKLVFGVYFRVLKARTPSLMGTVLEGLVRYAHLINQDFFGDLLEALKELIAESEKDPEEEEEEGEARADGSREPGNAGSSRDSTRESLLCVITAFALLQGQDGVAAARTLDLDLTFFTNHLYRTLHPASLDADVELGARALRLPDPDAAAERAPRVDVHTTIVLLLRSLRAVLLPASGRAAPPPVRLAAFAKQVLTAALQLPERSATAALGLAAQALRAHARRLAPLWHTERRRGDGLFDPTAARPEAANALAATAWEGELLRLHYAPAVRDGLAHLESLVAAEAEEGGA